MTSFVNIFGVRVIDFFADLYSENTCFAGDSLKSSNRNGSPKGNTPPPCRFLCCGPYGIGGDCLHGSVQWCLCQHAKGPNRGYGKGLCLLLRRMAMHIRKVSPISVEIIARFGRKICVRVRVIVPIAALVVLISTAIKLGG